MGLPTFTLYHRQDCHLCEKMQRQLAALEEELGFAVSLIDIDTDPVLRERFNLKVPVLAFGDEIVCCYALDEPALRSALETEL